MYIYIYKLSLFNSSITTPSLHPDCAHWKTSPGGFCLLQADLAVGCRNEAAANRTTQRISAHLSASQRISVVRRLKLGICRRSNHVTFPRMTSPDVISYHTKLLNTLFLYSIEWLGHSSCTHKLQLTAGDASGHCRPLGLELVIRPLNRNTKAASESDQ